DLEAIVARALSDLAAAGDPAALENAKARYLGKNGELTALLKGLGKLSADERRSAGHLINEAKAKLEWALEARRAALAQLRMEEKLAAEALDVTLPGRGRGRGGLHPLSRIRRRRRPRDRDRLVQLHRAQQSRESSGAVDAGYVLRRSQGRAGAAA